jgi:hypothetical protein
VSVIGDSNEVSGSSNSAQQGQSHWSNLLFDETVEIHNEGDDLEDEIDDVMTGRVSEALQRSGTPKPKVPAFEPLLELDVGEDIHNDLDAFPYVLKVWLDRVTRVPEGTFGRVRDCYLKFKIGNEVCYFTTI